MLNDAVNVRASLGIEGFPWPADHVLALLMIVMGEGFEELIWGQDVAQGCNAANAVRAYVPSGNGCYCQSEHDHSIQKHDNG